jgi:hypothetical protein
MEKLHHYAILKTNLTKYIQLDWMEKFVS